MTSRDGLRATFDRVAELYDQKRPTPPPEMLDDLVTLAALRADARVLEIGCGTGQATLPMAERGYQITAVELGANLAAIARRNLAQFPRVDVQLGAFEEWPLPDELFDLVMAVNSFHWLDPAIALPKVCRALRAGGAIAIGGAIAGGHVEGGDTQFFNDAQACYEAHMPGTPLGLRLQPPEEFPLESPVIVASGLFEQPQMRRYVWLREFTTESYLGELNTYSGHIALSEENRTALLACIARMIDSQYNGRITKAYMTDLAVARKA